MSPTLSPLQLGSLQIFCKAAELESFTAAAEALGLTQAAVSRSVGRVEKRLGLQLFARTTRRVRLTDDGRLYFEHCRDALAQIDDVERLLTGKRTVPSGTLRISVPTTYGHYRLLPLLERFKRDHPAIALEIDVSNRNVDFVEQGYDLAIRLGVPEDSRTVMRRLEDAPLGIYASRAYLARRGVPRTLDDLRSHECIQFIRPSDGRPMCWIVRDGDADVDVRLASPVRFTGDVLGCVAYASADGGLFQTYDFIAKSAPYRDALVEVLAPYRGRSRPFCLLYPYQRHLPTRVRAFVDFLCREVDALVAAGSPGPAVPAPA